MQPTDEPILVPNDWIKLGSLKAGDSVLGLDGAPVVLQAVSQPEERECFRIMCDDGAWMRGDEDQELRVLKTRDAQLGTYMSVMDVRALYEKESVFLAKIGGLSGGKVTAVESIGKHRCASLTVPGDRIYVTRRMLVCRAPRP